MVVLVLLGTLLGFTSLCAYDEMSENITLRKKIEELEKKEDLKGDSNESN